MERIRRRLLPLLLLLLCHAASMAQDPWVRTDPDPPVDFKGLSFTAPTRGYLCGATGTLLATTDAGESWTFVPVPTTVDLWGVHAVEGSRDVHVAGDDGVVCSSTDDGATWTKRHAGYTQGFTFGITGHGASLLLVTGGEGAPGNTVGVICRSTDRGVTWTKATIAGTYSFDKATLVDSLVGYAAASTSPSFTTGAIYKTTDGGVSWGMVKQTSGAVNSIHCFDRENCVAVGFNGVLLRTSDGGATWSGGKLPTGGGLPPLTHVLFIDGSLGFAADAGFGGLLRTSDGGKNWTRETGIDPSEATIWTMAATRDAETIYAFAAGDGGALYRLIVEPTSAVAGDPAPTASSRRILIAPNPTRGESMLRLDAPAPGPVSITIVDQLGRELRRAVVDIPEAGPAGIALHLSELPAGLHVCRIEGAGWTETRTVLLIP